ncbi:antitoxin VapB family protein [Methanofollis sp. W23]|uniref:antitoxin VapB family protein n=1 Tax=Methanofollis sp. W23 TaxID=2817849 RepID=UPI001AE2E10C|nr:antitoxin VapB family protein [Methanofollis sp. W23]
MTRKISITDEAYDLLSTLKRSDTESFSDVIVRHYSRRNRRLSEVLDEVGECEDLADSIEETSKEMRGRAMKEHEL